MSGAVSRNTRASITVNGITATIACSVGMRPQLTVSCSTSRFAISDDGMLVADVSVRSTPWLVIYALEHGEWKMKYFHATVPASHLYFEETGGTPDLIVETEAGRRRLSCIGGSWIER